MTYAIAEAAHSSGLSIDTLRYYERIQLIDPPARDSGGRRAYSDEDLAWLSLALGRYEDRRTAVVDDANTIGTTYLRAQTLPEPMRSRSLPLWPARTASRSIQPANAHGNARRASLCLGRRSRRTPASPVAE